MSSPTSNRTKSAYVDEVDSYSNEQELDIKWVLGIIRRNLLIITFSTFAAISIAIFFALRMTPSYYAETRIFFETDRLNVVQIEDVRSSGIGLEDQMQLVLSQNVLMGVVDDLDLTEHPLFIAAALETEPIVEPQWLPVDFSGVIEPARRFLADVGLLSAPPVAATDNTEREAALQQEIVRSLRAGLVVRAVSTRVLSIAYGSPDPALSAAIVNATAERFILEQLTAKLAATRSATDWLAERTTELEERLRAAEASVEEARAELSQEAGQSTRITEAQVNSLNAALSEQQARIPGLEARYEGAREVLETGDFAAHAEFRGVPRLDALREREAEIEAQLRSLRTTVDEDHPAIRGLLSQASEVKRAMREEAQRVTNALRNDLEAARTAARELSLQLRSLETKSLEQSRAELRVRQLEREAEASRILYESFLGRLQETAEQQKLESSDARIISPADRPSAPTGSKKKLVVAGGAAAGGALGLALAFLLELLNTRFRHPRELEEATGYPVLGVLPSVGGIGRRRSLLDRLDGRRGRALSEAVRDLRTSIRHTNIDQPPQLVMFTSAAPGDGKSTTSVLTALASQEMGVHTLLVECDLRRPSIDRMFEHDPSSPGLISVLTGQASLDEAVFRDEDSGLDLLTVPRREQAATRRNPADVLSSRRLRELLDDLRGRYELVVLDAPPILAVSDARVIGALADAIVLVVRWRRTPRLAVQEGIEQLRRVRAPLVGLCMNSVNEKAAKRFSHQHYGFYSGEYRSEYL